MSKDKELADHERAHTGKTGAKVRHGANVTGANITGRHNNAHGLTDEMVEDMKKPTPDSFNQGW